MNRFLYYEQMKAHAREVRVQFGLEGSRILRTDLRRIYRQEGIRIDLWPHRLKDLRGAYFDDELGPTVMIAKYLPPDPRIFTMGHELKHHLEDRHLGLSYCDRSNENEPIEIGAEVFAAELIFPEADFVSVLHEMGVSEGALTAETLVHLKHATRTTLSYTGLAKRALRLRYAPPGTLEGVKWKRLEEELLGEPVYKRILRRRQAKNAVRSGRGASR